MTQYPGYQPPPPYSYQQPSGGRPTSVTVLAIIGIIWGALLLLCNVFGLIGAVALSAGTVTDPGMEALRENKLVWMSQMVMPVIGLIIAIVLIAGSIGSLMLKAWGRLAMIVYAVVAIVVGLLNAVVTLVYIAPTMKQNIPAGQNAEAFAAGQTFGMYCGILIVLAYPVFVLIFMNKPHVKAAFESGGATTGTGTGGYGTYPQ